MSLQVGFNEAGDFFCKGRPANFLSSVKNIFRTRNDQNIRHIIPWHMLRSGSQILMNSVIRKRSKQEDEVALGRLADSLAANYKALGIKFRYFSEAGWDRRIKQVLTIIYSDPRNLVVGDKIANQGIENARKPIRKIRKQIIEEFPKGFKNFALVKNKTLGLIVEHCKGKSLGNIAQYGAAIFKILTECVQQAISRKGIVTMLQNFELSCALDIVNDGTTREQNIRGLAIFDVLQQAIRDKDYGRIWNILIFGKI